MAEHINYQEGRDKCHAIMSASSNLVAHPAVRSAPGFVVAFRFKLTLKSVGFRYGKSSGENYT